jgi:hypothetical protein
MVVEIQILKDVVQNDKHIILLQKHVIIQPLLQLLLPPHALPSTELPYAPIACSMANANSISTKRSASGKASPIQEMRHP